MKPNFRKVLEMAIEQGVIYGYSRAHKHTENPTEAAITDNILAQVINSLDEWFDSGDEE